MIAIVAVAVYFVLGHLTRRLPRGPIDEKSC